MSAASLLYFFYLQQVGYLVYGSPGLRCIGKFDALMHLSEAQSFYYLLLIGSRTDSALY